MFRYARILGIGFLVAKCFFANIALSAEPGAKVELSVWRDARGNELDIAKWKTGPTVIAFLGTECPLAKQYANKLEKYHEQWSARGVRIVGVMSNAQDSPSEVLGLIKDQSLTFPFAVDPGAKIADQFGAERTPEVFVLDTEHRIRYRGRVDDQFSVGVSRGEVLSEDLKLAVEALLAGKSVSIPRTQASGCLIGRPKKPQANAKVTYHRDIVGILQKNCIDCHRTGEVAPFALTDYESVRGWAEMIEEVIREKRMPPWHANPEFGHFANERRLTEQEQTLISEWVKAGAPEGEPSAAPPAKTYTQGWQLPKQPDVVMNVTKQPFSVAADGEIKYQYFRVDPGITEDRWVSAAELLPGNRAVVHHILAFIRPKGSNERFNAERGFFTGYVPGLRVEAWPKGYAKRLPANSEFIFQVHYTTMGTKQEDQSKLGLIFCDANEVHHEVITESAVQTQLRIPPGKPDYSVSATSRHRFSDAAELLAMAPHMHMRGKAFRYELVSANGDKEVLLDVPHYDFNWQHSYLLDGPRKLSEGSRIMCSAVFDNSEDNPHNPDPKAWVSWGDQTWEEMMIGYFHFAVPLEKTGDAEPNKAASKIATNVIERAHDRIMREFDANGDKELSKQEVPKKHHALFDRLDRDANGIVTRNELSALPQ